MHDRFASFNTWWTRRHTKYIVFAQNAREEVTFAFIREWGGVYIMHVGIIIAYTQCKMTTSRAPKPVAVHTRSSAISIKTHSTFALYISPPPIIQFKWTHREINTQNRRLKQLKLPQRCVCVLSTRCIIFRCFIIVAAQNLCHKDTTQDDSTPAPAHRPWMRVATFAATLALN